MKIANEIDKLKKLLNITSIVDFESVDQMFKYFQTDAGYVYLKNHKLRRERFEKINKISNGKKN